MLMTAEVRPAEVAQVHQQVSSRAWKNLWCSISPAETSSGRRIFTYKITYVKMPAYFMDKYIIPVTQPVINRQHIREARAAACATASLSATPRRRPPRAHAPSTADRQVRRDDVQRRTTTRQ